MAGRLYSSGAFVSLIEIPASPLLGAGGGGEVGCLPRHRAEGSTHSERCPPKLASLKGQETGALPSPVPTPTLQWGGGGGDRQLPSFITDYSY